MGYVSITKLSLLIQEKLNKLNAGNLSDTELDELKDLTGELNERVVILHYKSKELALLRQADDILSQNSISKPQETTLAEPIKISIGTTLEAKNSIQVPIELESEHVKHITITQDITANEVNVPHAEPPTPLTELKATPVTEKKTIPVKQENNPGAKGSLVERMQKTKVNDLKTAIGLNQKFLFMNFLFEGENNSYNDAIDKLNNMPTAADARHYIRELSYVYNWNFEDENVILFTEYVERRHL